jgi:7-cyano-7-deazaguanine reductase
MAKRSSPVRGRAALPKATLGKKRKVPFTYAPNLLEAVPLSIGRDFSVGNLWVTNNGLRFTSLCPVTGQPDWADLFINYIPNERIVESKSLKEYLHSFRMHGDFHEDICRIVCDDLVRLLSPRYLEVIGQFDSRGSIAIWPFVQYAESGDSLAEAIYAERLRGYAPGKYASTQYQRSI